MQELQFISRMLFFKKLVVYNVVCHSVCSVYIDQLCPTEIAC